MANQHSPPQLLLHSDSHRSLSAAQEASPHVIGIGASAGGLRAISTLLAALPASFPAPIVIVQHLSPHTPSQMAAILSRRTALYVKQAEAGDRLAAGTVYVAPPARHLLVSADRALSLSDAGKVHRSRPSVDVLFFSLAQSIGAKSVGVVLTGGGGGDGAEGIQAIKAAGGTTFAQDEQSSQDASMPRSAAATGDVDFVLPLLDIAAALNFWVNPGRGSSPKKVKSEAEAAWSAKLDLCLDALFIAEESLRVAEEALRVQGDVIADYKRLSSVLAPGSAFQNKAREDDAAKKDAYVDANF